MEQAGPGRDNSPSEIVCGKGMGSGEITGTGPERPGEDGGMREPKSPGQRVKTTGLRPWMQSVDWDNMWNLKTTHVYLWRIHFDIWQNQYNYVKFKNKIKF